jgi:hypothetical protein
VATTNTAGLQQLIAAARNLGPNWDSNTQTLGKRSISVGMGDGSIRRNDLSSPLFRKGIQSVENGQAAEEAAEHRVVVRMSVAGSRYACYNGCGRGVGRLRKGARNVRA